VHSSGDYGTVFEKHLSIDTVYKNPERHYQTTDRLKLRIMSGTTTGFRLNNGDQIPALGLGMPECDLFDGPEVV
jgi:hypothetical protein